MNNEHPQPACITIRYGDKRFLLCADEVTNFMINCERLGFSGPEAIVGGLEQIKRYVPGADPTSLALIDEFALSLRACVFADP